MRRIFVVLLMLLPFGLWYDQNFHIRVREFPLAGADVNAPFTILHISDLHGMNWGNSNAPLLKKIRQTAPDLICLTGDMHTRGDAAGRQIALALAAELCRIAPTCYVPGEHDRTPDFHQALAANGVVLPGTEGVRLREDIHVYGCSRIRFDETSDLSQEYSLQEDAFDILLCHIPHPAAFAGAAFDLMLCGDTHGGIVQLPFIGALHDGNMWLPELRSARACFIHGMTSVGSTTVHITAGLGGMPLRFGVPPEIAVIHIFPDTKNSCP